MIFLEYIRKNQIREVVLNLLTCGLFVLSCTMTGYLFRVPAFSCIFVIGLITGSLFVIVGITTSALKENIDHLVCILTLIFGALGFFIGVSL